MLKKNKLFYLKAALIVVAALLTCLFIAGDLSSPFITNSEATDSHARDSGVTVLNNPYRDIDWDTVKHYKANLHTHTTQSDGLHDPDYVISAYQGAGYQILALTDHDTQGPGGAWPPTTTPTWPWVRFGRDPDLLYPEMLPVKGNEISSPHHHGSYFTDWGAAETTIEFSLEEIGWERDGLAILFHPSRYTTLYTGKPYPAPLDDSWYITLFEQYHNNPLVGMEVHNQGDSYPDDRGLWDRLNAYLMPDIIVFGYSNDDMHHKSDMFKNFQFMLMEDLSEESLRKAMISGAFYFCYEPDGDGSALVPIIENISVSEDGTEITITAFNIDLGQSGNAVLWRSNNGVIGTGFTIDLKQREQYSDIFIRAELINENGITYTQPFALQQSGNGEDVD